MIGLQRARHPGRIGAVVAIAIAIAVGTNTCGLLDADDGATASLGEAPPVHIDSVFPIEEEIRRFRAAIPESVSVMTGGATSREELVNLFVAALETDDQATFSGLALTVAEFAYLYYPSTQYTKRPYELSPSLLWFQLQNYGSRGLTRARTRYGERPLKAVGHACPDEPEVEGGNRLWRGCVIQHVNAAGDTVNVSLFGAIIERDGLFKFINYANRL